MRRRGWLVAVLVGLTLCAAGFWGLWQTRGVHVVVRNVGSATLADVVIHVTGNSYRIGNLAPGQSREVAVQCQGESGVRVDFAEPDGQRRRLDEVGYFESSHYRGVIKVDVGDGQIKRVDDRIGLSLY